VLGQAGSGQENSKMGGSKTGADAVKSVFKSSVNRVITQPVTSKAEADQIALGQFQNRAIDYITAEGSCLGNPDLRVGKVIEIQGVGKKFTGLYYVVKTVQRWSLDEGYHTFFTARRTAI
jgi:phage protein D